MVSYRPPTIEIDVRRGSNVPPVIFGLENDDGTPFQSGGAEYVLTLRTPGATLRKSTAQAASGFVLDPASGDLIWTPTLSDTRAIPLGRLSRGEVERRVGESQDLLFSLVVTGIGGLSDD